MHWRICVASTASATDRRGAKSQTSFVVSRFASNDRTLWCELVKATSTKKIEMCSTNVLLAETQLPDQRAEGFRRYVANSLRYSRIKANTRKRLAAYGPR